MICSPLMPRPNLHFLAEERSLALHAAVAERLRENPTLLEVARARVSGWIERGSVSSHYAQAWQEILARPLEDVLQAIVDPGEGARALRQVSPFAGVIDPRSRWRILREVRERMGV